VYRGSTCLPPVTIFLNLGHYYDLIVLEELLVVCQFIQYAGLQQNPGINRPNAVGPILEDNTGFLSEGSEEYLGDAETQFIAIEVHFESSFLKGTLFV
jgi:hypothetical protein